MTGLSASPRVIKGAMVGISPLDPLASVVVFQYNPDSLERTVRPRAAGESADRGEALRLGGPPEETIALTIELDAADGLETGDPIAVGFGVGPALAALETLVTPRSPLAIANEALAAAGMLEVIPPEAPLTLFVWGPKRVVPVRLESFTITEQAFDPALNPIQADVRLSLKVLTYHELGAASAGGALSLAHHVTQETLARLSPIGTLTNAVTG